MSRFSFGLSPSSQALRACTQSASAPAANTACASASSAGSGSCSSTPMRHLTVTGTETAAFIAATQSATRSGVRIRQAPKVPDCTRSDGQPTFRLISSIAAGLGDLARLAPALPDRHRRAAAPPDARPDRSRAAARGRHGGPHRPPPSPYRAAPAASAGGGRTGNAGPSSPSWVRRRVWKRIESSMSSTRRFSMPPTI